jgi:hypothetical protein
MKMKVVVIDLEIPPSFKKWGIRLGLPIALLIGGSTIAWATMLHTWNAGDRLDAADLNGNFATLQAEIAALQQSTRPPSAFRALLSTQKMIPNGSQTSIAFDNVDYDLAREYDPSSGIFKPAHSGIYLLSCEAWGGAFGDAGVWSSTIYRNGFPANDYQIEADDVQNSSATTTLTSHAMAIVSLVQGDTLLCSLYQTTGGTVTIGNGFATRTTFSAARLY